MADEKKTVKENPGKGAKIVNFFKNLPEKIATPFKNMWHEMKKVTWPTKQDLIKYSCIVLLFMVFMGIVIGLLDMGSSRLVTAVSSLKKTSDEQIIVDATDGAATTVEETAQEAVTDAQNAVENAAEEVKTEAENAAEEVKTEAEGAAEEVKTETEAVVEEVKETVEQAAEQAEGAAEAPASGN